MKNLRTFIFCAVILASVIFSSLVRAQTAPAGNRYLIIVETAKAMKPALRATRQCVQDMLASGLNGQLRAGDTLGLWTYNNNLHAGEFPMQVWNPAQTNEIAGRVDDFLKQQRCSDTAWNTDMLIALFQVIANSDNITVLIFSDGAQPLQGTPFDVVINQIYTKHRNELSAAKIPFVTVLQARGGKIVNGIVNPGRSPVNIPVLPPAPKRAPAKAKAKPAPPAPVLVKTNASLIVDYSSSNTVPVVALPSANPNAPIATNLPPPLVIAPAIPVTSSLAGAVAETSAPPPLATIKPVTTPILAAPAQTTLTTNLGDSTVAFSPAPERKPTNTPPLLSANAEVKPATSEEALENPKGARAAIAVLALLVVVLTGWIIKRRRATAHTSVITESFERRGK